MMKETVHTFGEAVRIFGVLTEPASQDGSDRHLPTIILLNAGLLGRIGPYRLHVILARELAKFGFTTFRIDLSGIGDSGRHRDNRQREQQHLDDVRHALKYLENARGDENFIVMGICTGADNAHRVMKEDDRVVGAVCVDGYSYRTLRFYLHHYWPKVTSLKSWKNLFRKALGLVVKTSAGVVDDAEDDQLDYRWKLPPKKQTESDLRDFINRRARLLCVYTAGWKYNYPQQLADAFKSLNFGDTITTTYLPNATHTFKVEEDRTQLIRAITSWLNNNWSHAS